MISDTDNGSSHWYQPELWEDRRDITARPDRWRTPPEVLKSAAALVGFRMDATKGRRTSDPIVFAVDVAADAKNTVAEWWIDSFSDALKDRAWALQVTADADWLDQIVDGDPNWARKHELERVAWCNPPYSNKNGGQLAWARRCWLASLRGWTVALLIPASPTTRCGVFCGKHASEIYFSQGRIAFLHPDTGKPVGGNPLGSQLVVFRPDTQPGSVEVVFGWGKRA